MMISNTQESLLPTARSLHSRQGSPVKGSVNSFEGRLVTVLVLAVFIGVVTFWKVPGLPLPAVSPRQPQPALATNLAPVPVRRIRDVGASLYRTSVGACAHWYKLQHVCMEISDAMD